MATKIIAVPNVTINLLDARGIETGVSKNTLLHFMSVVNENNPQKSDTDAIICKGIKEKIDAYSGGDTFELEEPEIFFLQQGITVLRERSAMSGSSWHYLITALREAKTKPRMSKIK